MSSSDESVFAEAKALFNSQQYLQAIDRAQEAVNAHPESVNSWWYMCLSQCALGDYDSAHESIREVLDLAPDFSNGWSRYGIILQKYYEDENDEDALKAFETAVKCDPTNASALTSLSALYRRLGESENSHKNKFKEIQVLELLDEVEGLTPNQLNYLGILHYDVKNFFDAIKYWERNVSAPGGASLYNLGLAFNHREVSQDADAIDIWRIALQEFPDDEKSQDRIEELLPRLLQLSKDSHKYCNTILNRKFFYDFYINPYELLGYDSDQIDGLEIDFKDIQKKRKRLLQEIDLEDGAVHWLNDLIIEKSKAIGIIDELHDEQKRQYHALVFNNNTLLKFLTKGEHRHFCVDEFESPISIIKILDDKKSKFRDWLTPIFTKQFDRVLASAISERQLDIIEVMLDGRRWINPAHTEECFISSKKILSGMLDNLESFADSSQVDKLSADDVYTKIIEGSLLQMLNLMPSFFWEQQDRALRSIRDIAIAAYNIHGDAENSKEIMELAKEFEFKSSAHEAKLLEDFEAINEIISQEREKEVHLTMQSGKQKFSITKEGVTRGAQFIPIENLTKIRFGTNLVLRNGKETCESEFVFKDNTGETISVEHSYLRDSQTGQDLSTRIHDGIFEYLLPTVVSNIRTQLESGLTLSVGALSISQAGISFITGLIFKKTNLLRWGQIDSKLENGSLVILSTVSRLNTSVSLKNEFNAFPLHILIQESKK